ncbi:MAG: alpha/beta hydrolase-fold protein [Weeksellaceae bacterium]|nr:alpha/beta hydrolase-fold protein [Weeksellaceae bacterium]
MKKSILLICAIFLSQIMLAQVTLHVVSVPNNTPPDAEIFFAGSLNDWNPGNPNYILQVHEDSGYFITFPEGEGTVEYKFTRGSWASVEGNENGGFIPNRSFSFTGSAQTITLYIQSWEDLGAGGGSTATDNVQVLSESFYMPQLDRHRKIMIYLPPDYYTSSKDYPVLYMHDGQNLFDNQTAYAGEWEVDETLNALQDQGDWGAIVIGIYNGEDLRINELSPWVNTQYGGGEGHAYITFIAETLKPFVDENFRTKPEPQFTALIGSSLGGLISTYGGMAFPEVFGKVGALSPSYWFNNTELMAFVSQTSSDFSDMRIAMIGGATESSTMEPYIQSMRNALLDEGVDVTNILVQIDEDGAHSEWYWRREFGDMYQWLFSEETLSTSAVRGNENFLKFLFPSNIHYSGVDSNQKAMIFNASGQWISTMSLSPGNNQIPQSLKPGVYFLHTEKGNLKFLIR